MGKDWIALNHREQIRLMILNEILQGSLSRREAADALHVCQRQLCRLLTAYREDGAAALAHGNRGRAPSNRIAEPVRQRVLALAQGPYQGINDVHLSELLAREEGITLSRATVRRILRQAGVLSPQKRRPPKHRQRRERMPRPGMLLLMDASQHDWLQSRGSRLTLLGCVDDATGTVPAAFFQPTGEDTLGYFRLLHSVALRAGLPEAIYVDRHAVFATTVDARLSIEEQLQGARSRPTQFAQLLERLHVAVVFAHSPQAKGRIERLWRTFQDRLVAELRLAKACDPDQANTVLETFLPDFNRRFAVPAADPNPAFRPAPGQLDELFTVRFRCFVAPDHTVRSHGHHLQLLPAPGERSYVRCRVELRQHLDGRLSLHYGEQEIASRPAPPDAAALRQKPSKQPPQRSKAVKPVPPPGPDHPWRRYGAFKNSRRTFSLNT